MRRAIERRKGGLCGTAVLGGESPLDFWTHSFLIVRQGGHDCHRPKIRHSGADLNTVAGKPGAVHINGLLLSSAGWMAAWKPPPRMSSMFGIKPGFGGDPRNRRNKLVFAERLTEQACSPAGVSELKITPGDEDMGHIASVTDALHRTQAAALPQSEIGNDHIGQETARHGHGLILGAGQTADLMPDLRKKLGIEHRDHCIILDDEDVKRSVRDGDGPATTALIRPGIKLLMEEDIRHGWYGPGKLGSQGE